MTEQTIRRCRRALAIAAACITATATGVGCSASQREPQQVSPAAKAEAEQLFDARCATCHGREGWGNGPEAAKLERRPRNFSDPTWQLAVSDRHLDKVIVEGGAAVGKSKQMPPNPDLAQRPEVLAALRLHLRVLASNPGP